jgi:trans-aconitate 2-methyltransferase
MLWRVATACQALASMPPLTSGMAEWNAETYHRVSDPHVAWGMRVLARLPLDGDECVLDVGCGTGRLTERLLERLPRGHVVALDLSPNMLQAARGHLAPRFAKRVSFTRADAAALPVAGRADAVFSTATFHWVLDHPALFRSILAALKPGGRLVAQCGGGPNIQRLHDRCEIVGQRPEFELYFRGWRGPWEYADAATTARRLADVGFSDIATSLEASPVVHPDAATYREFVTNVICRNHLARLPDEELRNRFMDVITEQAANDAPPFEIDYWRLNLDARKPG